ncbi:hypothetical protein [Ralstonia sp. UBA689]|uniref:hypothetical protein n=1 Tax=Ralstonia sp. UBA689 TaxID=1947373 RepID=UPI0025F29506|nr:hypothetical protein [Ralstonia sp. UBA689]
MLEAQPDEVVAATLWELEKAVSAALPPSALIQASRSACGGYNVLAQWSFEGSHGNRMPCTLACHISATEVRTYCGLNHPKREVACASVGAWLRAELERKRQAAQLSPDTGFDMQCAAPAACFRDDAEPVRVTTQDKAHDFALYRGAPPPRLT